MSNKINHNRPHLRYIDNLRRELRREDRPSPNWFDPGQIEALSVTMQQPETFPSHVIDFQKLELGQQKIASCAMGTYSEYMEATCVVISRIIGSNAKARKAAKIAQDAAHESFVVTGAVLFGSIIDDAAAGRQGYLNWFQRFYEGLDNQSKSAWTDFTELLMKESLPLYFAQQVADSPERVEGLRELFSEENWQ